MDPETSPKSFHILIVDDDPDDHFLLRNAFNKILPCALIESVYDGSEALVHLKTKLVLPDLIILDLNMVKITGQDTLRVIKQNESLSEVPVIIYTTSRNEAEKKKMLEMGARGFYSKAYNNKDLLQIIQNVKADWLT